MTPPISDDLSAVLQHGPGRLEDVVGVTEAELRRARARGESSKRTGRREHAVASGRGKVTAQTSSRDAALNQTRKGKKIQRQSGPAVKWTCPSRTRQGCRRPAGQRFVQRSHPTWQGGAGQGRAGQGRATAGLLGPQAGASVRSVAGQVCPGRIDLPRWDKRKSAPNRDAAGIPTQNTAQESLVSAYAAGQGTIAGWCEVSLIQSSLTVFRRHGRLTWVRGGTETPDRRQFDTVNE